MFEAARRRFARTAALDAVAHRQVGRGSSLLVALAPDEDQQRAAWAFLSDLNLPPSSIHAVVMGDRVAYAPDAFAGHVQTLGETVQDWRRLPRRTALEPIWAQAPSVALHLADSGDLSAAYLVGASPASVRIGPHEPEDEAFYDLMVVDRGDVASRIVALRRMLAQITPPVLPLRA